MRIAIDIRTLNSPKTGDRSVCLGFVRGLIRIAEQEKLELALIGRQPPARGLLPESAAITIHLTPPIRGYRWMMSAFPRACQAVAADVALIQYMGPFRSPCPFVTLIHDTVWRSMPETFPRLNRLILNAFIPGTIRRAAAVVTGSEFAASELKRHYRHARNKTHVVPYAIDEIYRPVTNPARLSELRARYNLPEQYILSVGLLQPRKNVQGLLQAYQMLPEDLRREYGLVITGKRGWMVDQVLSGLQGLGASVTLTGYVPDEDLPALYTMASCFAYPSFYEGFGLPPLEAMACGVPVVTSRVASLPEVCGDAALLVNPHQTDAISAAIQRLLRDDSLRAELMAKGLVQAAKYNWTESARQLVPVLRAAAGVDSRDKEPLL